MRCLFCNSEIDRMTIASLLLEDDQLCPRCRKALRIRHRFISIDGVRIETFYEYDGMFRNILLQYKECYDEALKDVLLYGIRDYLALRYPGYVLLGVPSSERKLKERGFDHLELLFESCPLKMVKGLKMREQLVQEGKDARQRMAMKSNYFYEGEPLNRVLIVDDVVTTGSSLLGSYLAVKSFSKSVKLLSLAYKDHFTNCK